MTKKIILISILLFLGSCTKYWYKPNGKIFDMMPKGGSMGYNLGWKHGCQSGLATQFSGAIGMTFYQWSRDPDITSVNPNIPAIRERYPEEFGGVNWGDPVDIRRNFSDYNLVFWDAHAFCRQTALGSLRSSIGNPPIPSETRYIPQNIGDIYGIGGPYDSRIGSTGMW